ncbi:unnamed protein product [Ixodes pacificus]
MSTLELYTKGTRIWLPDAAAVWKAAEITKGFDGSSLEVEDENGEKQVLAVNAPDKLPPLRNPEILIGGNDLTSLSYLHEPAGELLLVYTIYAKLYIMVILIW